MEPSSYIKLSWNNVRVDLDVSRGAVQGLVAWRAKSPQVNKLGALDVGEVLGDGKTLFFLGFREPAIVVSYPETYWRPSWSSSMPQMSLEASPLVMGISLLA